MDTTLFVQNIKFFCEKKGVKPTVACRDSGAGADLINQLERRGSVPSVGRVQLLAQYLGVTVSDLLGETWQEQELPSLAPGDQDLVDAYHRADKDTRLIVDTALKPFKKEKKSAQAG